MSLKINEFSTNIQARGEKRVVLELSGYGENNVDFRGMLGKDISEYLVPRNVVIRCAHCGQWGAVKCACKHCGAPMPAG